MTIYEQLTQDFYDNTKRILYFSCRFLELVKTEQDGWKTRTNLIFIDVNFHHEVAQNDEGSKTEIKDFLSRYFHSLCNKTGRSSDFLQFFTVDVRNNIAGKMVSIKDRTSFMCCPKQLSSPKIVFAKLNSVPNNFRPKRLFELGTSCVANWSATTVPARHNCRTGSLN